jgi:valyl-tRNA synthetase
LAAERKRIGSELENITKQADSIVAQLNNPGFVDKAPAAVVEQRRAKLGELAEKRRQLAERLSDLE